jgi:2-hydroxymuconate-semialdehyde hydrolase
MTHDIKNKIMPLGAGQLDVLVSGREDGKPLVLLHGIPTSAELFRDVVPYFTTLGYRVYAPFMPGYGQTRFPTAVDYRLATVADLYAIWLEQLNLGPVWLVGHDLGGAVAQLIAVRYPHLISHLTMGDTVVGDSFPVLPILLMQGIAEWGLYDLLVRLNLIPNPLVNRALRDGFAHERQLTPEMLARVFWDSKVHDPDGRREWVRHVRDLRNDENVVILPDLCDVNIPTLLIWAAGDVYQPWYQVGKYLESLLTQSARTSFVLVQNAGHFLPLEAPQEYAVTLLNWRKRLLPRR